MKVITKEMLQSPTVTLSWQRKIGILLDRDTALLSAVYNCYRRGITFVPLDARWPRDRLCGILQNAGVDTVLTARPNVLPYPALPWIILLREWAP